MQNDVMDLENEQNMFIGNVSTHLKKHFVLKADADVVKDKSSTYLCHLCKSDEQSDINLFRVNDQRPLSLLYGF